VTFLDLSPEEFQSTILMKKKIHPRKEDKNSRIGNKKKLTSNLMAPSAFDWYTYHGHHNHHSHHSLIHSHLIYLPSSLFIFFSYKQAKSEYGYSSQRPRAMRKVLNMTISY
jgi:hypothetical protein